MSISSRWPMLRDMAAPIVAGFLYMPYLALALCSPFSTYGSIDLESSLETYGVMRCVLSDFILCLLYPVAAYLLLRKRPYMEASRGGIRWAVGLIVAYGVVYAVFGRKDIVGFYEWIRVLFFVALSEELLFRRVVFGCLYAASAGKGQKIAAYVISGALWGIGHAVAPAVVSGDSSFVFFISFIGGGIVQGAIFAFLYAMTRCIAVPVAVHAWMNYLGTL